jgi:hypothetical protein
MDAATPAAAAARRAEGRSTPVNAHQGALVASIPCGVEAMLADDCAMTTF